MTRNERRFTNAYLSYTITKLHLKSISKIYEFHKNLFDLTMFGILVIYGKRFLENVFRDFEQRGRVWAIGLRNMV
jgi:hypothetical protein